MNWNYPEFNPTLHCAKIVYSNQSETSVNHNVVEDFLLRGVLYLCSTLGAVLFVGLPCSSICTVVQRILSNINVVHVPLGSHARKRPHLFHIDLNQREKEKMKESMKHLIDK